ncbi:hypothetical protein FEM48_Zijuj12G0119300 [Ziziphus jujuba var. spinosa]|uniref:Uncharacterized protein n=1 Tax=Ziziphus jujuba var. spinosa TaxID=714518 RepID=A0A978UD65_ZIZJJ|nr:hypothetical protein FEM48_Zijuj12G0119300 [Ziziphus jujuba var. spinosa]
MRETKNFKVAFSAFTICAQSTAWKVGEQDPETKRRLIVTGDDGSYSNYFYISKEQVCLWKCGGSLVENGKSLLALDGSVLPVVFERA